jgi:hypothetical protein
LVGIPKFACKFSFLFWNNKIFFSNIADGESPPAKEQIRFAGGVACQPAGFLAQASDS